MVYESNNTNATRIEQGPKPHVYLIKIGLHFLSSISWRTSPLACSKASFFVRLRASAITNTFRFKESLTGRCIWLRNTAGEVNTRELCRDVLETMVLGLGSGNVCVSRIHRITFHQPFRVLALGQACDKSWMIDLMRPRWRRSGHHCTCL